MKQERVRHMNYWNNVRIGVKEPQLFGGNCHFYPDNKIQEVHIDGKPEVYAWIVGETEPKVMQYTRSIDLSKIPLSKIDLGRTDEKLNAEGVADLRKIASLLPDIDLTKVPFTEVAIREKDLMRIGLSERAMQSIREVMIQQRQEQLERDRRKSKIKKIRDVSLTDIKHKPLLDKKGKRMQPVSELVEESFLDIIVVFNDGLPTESANRNAVTMRAERFWESVSKQGKQKPVALPAKSEVKPLPRNEAKKMPPAAPQHDGRKPMGRRPVKIFHLGQKFH